MASESDPTFRRVPSLVSYCQRVLSAHADAISSLGDDIRYDVIRPVLECCSADTLLRLEQSSPFLEQDTSDLWERLCFQSYPLLAEQLVRNADEQPDSWRDQYFLLCRAEAHRLEEVASRLRNQRIEAAERKKEREVKWTDKLPPAKRARSAWGTSSQPKSLFQKTKNEATKLRRSLYVPPKILHTRVQRPTTSSLPVTPPTRPANSRINTKSVSAPRRLASISQAIPRSVQSTDLPDRPSPKCLVTTPHLPSPAHPQPQAIEPGPSKPPIQKRDPMASLFMPKHRALSQVPSQMGKSSVVTRSRVDTCH